MMELHPLKPRFHVGRMHRHRHGFTDAQRRRLAWLRDYEIFAGAGGLVPTVPFSPSQLPSLTAWYDASSPGSLSGDGAVALASASSQYLSCADNASIRINGKKDFGFACLANFTDHAATYGVASKGTTNGNGQGWSIQRVNTDQKIYFLVSDGTTFGEPNTAGAVADGGWHLIFCWYDSTGGNVYVQVDNNAAVSAAFSSTVSDNGLSLCLGSIQNAQPLYCNGSLASSVYMISPPGGFGNGGVGTLAKTAHDALWNGGNFLDCRDITATQKTAWGVVASYAEGSTANLVKDYTGTNTMVNNNAATYAAGPVTTTSLTDGDAVSKWSDLSGNGNHLLQATAANRPVYKVNIQNGLPVVRFSTTNFMTMAAPLSLTDSSMGLVWKPASTITNADTVITWSRSVTTQPRGWLLFGNVTGAVPSAVFNYTSQVGSVLYGSHNDTNLASAWQTSLATLAGSTTALYTNGSSLSITGTYAGGAMNSGGGTQITNIDNFGDSSAGPNADIGEKLIGKAGWSSTQVGQLNTYWRNKWGF